MLTEPHSSREPLYLGFVRYNRVSVHYNREKPYMKCLKPNLCYISVRYKGEFAIKEFVTTCKTNFKEEQPETT